MKRCFKHTLEYTEIESATTVKEKLTLEKQLEIGVSELKKAQAALAKALKEKRKILEAEVMDEAMFNPVNLSDNEVEWLIDTVKVEAEP